MPSAVVVWNTDPRRGPTLIRSELRRWGWQTELIEARTRPLQRAAAREAIGRGAEAVVAVGGDGTVVTVAQELAGGRIPLGIVPGGTGNLIAVNLGIPLDPVRACAVIAKGARRTIDLGRAHNEHDSRSFAVACGIGFDALVMARTSDARKRRLGRLAYAATAVGAAREIRDVAIDLSVDGRTWRTAAAQVLIANMGSLTGWFSPRGRIAMDDGVFDILVLRANGAVSGAATLAHGLLSTAAGNPTSGRLFRLRGRAVRVLAQDLVPAELDGDLFGTTPLEAEIEPGAMTVLVPRA